MTPVALLTHSTFPVRIASACATAPATIAASRPEKGFSHEAARPCRSEWRVSGCRHGFASRCLYPYATTRERERDVQHCDDQRARVAACGNGVRVTAVIAGGVRTPFLLERFPDLDPQKLQDPRHVANAVPARSLSGSGSAEVAGSATRRARRALRVDAAARIGCRRNHCIACSGDLMAMMDPERVRRIPRQGRNARPRSNT